MLIKCDGHSGGPTHFTLNIRCPHCHTRGTFEPFSGVADCGVNHGTINAELLGQRRCPNPDCRGHVFFIAQKGKLVGLIPPERIDFDAIGIPERIVSVLEEAITCHANGCFTAAAIMVRKALEELCDDRGAKGDNLKLRIADLGARVVLPKELLDALDHIRLLGNDAAHLEAKVYKDIGKAELEAAIALAKEILKATFQYASLLQQLRALQAGGM